MKFNATRYTIGTLSLIAAIIGWINGFLALNWVDISGAFLSLLVAFGAIAVTILFFFHFKYKFALKKKLFSNYSYCVNFYVYTYIGMN